MIGKISLPITEYTAGMIIFLWLLYQYDYELVSHIGDCLTFILLSVLCSVCVCMCDLC